MKFVVALLVALVLGTACAKPAAPPLPVPVVDLQIRSAELDGRELLTALKDVSRLATENKPGTLEVLCRLSSHPDYLVRIRAMKALSDQAYRHSPEAYAEFVRGLSDSHWLVRSFAARGLELTGRVEAISALEGQRQVESHKKVQGRIDQALLRLKEIGAESPLGHNP